MLGKLFGGNTIKAVGNIVDELYTSEEEKAAAKLAIQKVEAELKKRQMDINLADAQSTAGGISGAIQRIWRPLIGFSCALAIFWEFVFKQFLMFILATFKIETLPLPNMDLQMLMPLCMSLLGLASIRTYEKQKGINIDKK